MRTLHFDCFSGISGDMTLGALFDAGVDAGAVRAGLDSLGLGITLRAEKVRKGGFAATHVRIEAPHEHKHRHLHHVEEILHKGALTDAQRELALRIFRRLAEAEAAVHGLPLERVHFHEVGALDSIADIVGAAIALDLLAPDHVTCTPVPTGSGMVECAHGLMPVPAPGTAELLKGVPLRPSLVEAELTTPTGAAILATVVDAWTDTPAMTVERIGHGAGTMDFEEQPNILRVFVGTAAPGSAPGDVEADTVWQIETNLDDIPAEVVGFCYERLLAAGAVDVYSTPILMKKNRPGVTLTALVPDEHLARVEDVLFRETGTLGVRRRQVHRHKLRRRACTVETPWGPVQGKLAWRRADDPPRFSAEYEECARVARQHGVPLREVYAEVHRAFEEQVELMAEQEEE